MYQLIIIGASGHGKVVADIARLCGYKKIDFLDDNQSLKNCGTYKVIGLVKDLKKYINDMTCFFVAIGDNKIRKLIQNEIEALGGKIGTLIHPDAVIANDVEIGRGSVLMAGTVINSGAIIGNGCVINTASSVDHDCKVGEFVHIAVGAHLSGSVKIQEITWVGAGATISNNVSICGNCMIGAGAVVVEDITTVGVYIGVPAKISKNLFVKESNINDENFSSY